MTLKLIDSSSQLSFKIIKLRNDFFTVEFWFKLTNPRSYESLSHIFSLTDLVTGRTYMEIFIAKGKLVCAPFGAQNRKRPYLMFKDFNVNNED
jgi:hypothetical protein